MNLFEFPAWWYTTIAIVVSAYQAYRGVVFQLQYARHQKINQKVENPKTLAIGAQSEKEIWLLHAVADGLLYLLSTLSGFLSLLLAYRILDRAPSFEGISVGGAAVFVFLALFGVLGITGQLPHLLQQGKWPR